MKICPICKARCFSDMEICFGCMHRFNDEHKDRLAPEYEQGREDPFEERARANGAPETAVSIDKRVETVPSGTPSVTPSGTPSVTPSVTPLATPLVTIPLGVDSLLHQGETQNAGKGSRPSSAPIFSPEYELVISLRPTATPR